MPQIRDFRPRFTPPPGTPPEIGRYCISELGMPPFVVYDGIARKKNITWWPLGPAGTVMSFLYLSYSYVVW